MIGAGGAARAIVIAIARHGVQKIDIANRTIGKAEQLVKHATNLLLGSAISIHDAEEQLSEYDIVINTTSVGMSPHVTDSPLQVHNLKRGTIVSDLIYNPLTTLFLKQAKERGALIDNGVGMFVHQGALAFEKWTGFSEP